MAVKGSHKIDAALSNWSLKYENADYIVPGMLKDLPVKHEYDEYWIYARQYNIEESIRSPGTASKRITLAYSTGSYHLEWHALNMVASDHERENHTVPGNLNNDMADELTDKILMEQEYECAKVLMTSTSFSNNATLTSQTSWRADTSTSVPIQNILSGTGYILKYGGGHKPNSLIFSWDVFESLANNENIYSRIQYVERSIITEDMLPSIFNVPKVHIGAAIYDQGKEGATESQTTIWGTNALLAYMSPKPKLREVTAALLIRGQRYKYPFAVKKWREEEVEGDIIELNTEYQFKTPATASGYLFKTVTL